VRLRLPAGEFAGVSKESPRLGMALHLLVPVIFLVGGLVPKVLIGMRIQMCPYIGPMSGSKLWSPTLHSILNHHNKNADHEKVQTTIYVSNIGAINIFFSFLPRSLTMVSMRAGQQHQQKKIAATTAVNAWPSAIDINIARSFFIPTIISALKQHICRSITLNAKDPLGGSVPFIVPAHLQNRNGQTVH